jgi:membrane protease subunit (stomatin/prohibitin family)
MTGTAQEVGRAFVESGRFSVGHGWLGLAESMLVEVLTRLEQDGIDLDGVSVTNFDVKEKRGRLVGRSNRFEGLDDIFDKYEQKSLRICEVCGGSGRLQGDGEWWLSTRCREHRIF